MPNKDLMKIDFVYNGNPERIPAIGSEIKIKEHILFKVEYYGESNSVIEKTYTSGETCTIELWGHIVIPKGTLIKVLENFLKYGLK